MLNGLSGAWRSRRRQQISGNENADVRLAKRDRVFWKTDTVGDLTLTVQKLDRCLNTESASCDDDLRVEGRGLARAVGLTMPTSKGIMI
jgi:hypothetical protein